MVERMVPEPTEPSLAGDERTTLVEFLDYLRSVLIRKGDGLTAEQLDTAPTVSSLTVGQLIRHMTMVESHWFEQCFAGRPEPEPWASADWESDPDWEMTSASEMTFAELRSDFDAACESSRTVVDTAPSLDAMAARVDHDRAVSLRWILVHMIEEYARHCGHADLIAEAIDGRSGD